jgi:hypothetical protein
VRLPAHLAHADQVSARWQPVGVLAPLGSPLADGAILLVAVATPLVGVLFVVGWRYRAIGPLFAVAILLLATLDSAWGQVFHTEHLVVLHLLILASAPAADVLAVGRRPAPPGPAAHGRYGWPVRLAAVVVVLAYVIAGIAKLRVGGLDWLDGDTLRNWVAHDNLRKAVLGDTYSLIGRSLVSHAWAVPTRGGAHGDRRTGSLGRTARRTMADRVGHRRLAVPPRRPGVDGHPVPLPAQRYRLRTLLPPRATCPPRGTGP